MENKVIFVDGINVFTPSENAPDWIKANMVINPTQLVKWLEQNDQHLGDGHRPAGAREDLVEPAEVDGGRYAREIQRRAHDRHGRHHEELPDKPIIVYCRAGSRSAQAAEFLDANAHDDIYNMLGGYTAWLALPPVRTAVRAQLWTLYGEY